MSSFIRLRTFSRYDVEATGKIAYVLLRASKVVGIETLKVGTSVYGRGFLLNVMESPEEILRLIDIAESTKEK